MCKVHFKEEFSKSGGQYAGGDKFARQPDRVPNNIQAADNNQADNKDTTSTPSVSSVNATSTTTSVTEPHIDPMEAKIAALKAKNNPPPPAAPAAKVALKPAKVALKPVVLEDAPEKLSAKVALKPVVLQDAPEKQLDVATDVAPPPPAAKEAIQSQSTSSVSVNEVIKSEDNDNKTDAGVDLKKDSSAQDMSGNTLDMGDSAEEENEVEISPEKDTKIEKEKEEEKEEDKEGDTSSVEVETGSKSNVPYYGESDIFTLVAKQQQMLAQRRLSQQKIQQQQMIVLASLYGQAGNRERFSQQNHTFTILKGSLGDDIPFLIIDASDPENYPQRDALLELSGMGPTYPQFFMAKPSAEAKEESFHDSFKAIIDQEKQAAKEDAEQNGQEDEDADEYDEPKLLGSKVALDDYEDIQFFGDYKDLFTANEQQRLRSSFLSQKTLHDDLAKDLDNDDEEKEISKEKIVESVPSTKNNGKEEVIVADIPSKAEPVEEEAAEEKIAEEEVEEEVADEAVTESVEDTNAPEAKMDDGSGKVDKGSVENTANTEESTEVSDETMSPKPNDTITEESANEEAGETKESTEAEDSIMEESAKEAAGETPQAASRRKTAVIIPDSGMDRSYNTSHEDKSSKSSRRHSEPVVKTYRPLPRKFKKEPTKTNPVLFPGIKLPEWVDTYMIGPENHVARMETTASRRRTEDDKLKTTTHITLTLRNGEEIKQSREVIDDDE